MDTLFKSIIHSKAVKPIKNINFVLKPFAIEIVFVDGKVVEHKITTGFRTFMIIMQSLEMQKSNETAQELCCKIPLGFHDVFGFTHKDVAIFDREGIKTVYYFLEES